MSNLLLTFVEIGTVNMEVRGQAERQHPRRYYKRKTFPGELVI